MGGSALTVAEPYLTKVKNQKKDLIVVATGNQHHIIRRHSACVLDADAPRVSSAACASARNRFAITAARCHAEAHQVCGTAPFGSQRNVGALDMQAAIGGFKTPRTRLQSFFIKKNF